MYPLTAQKIEISKKWKIYLEVPSFNISVSKILIIFYIAPEIWHVADAIAILYVGLFLPLYPANSLKKENFKKMKRKKHLEISFSTNVPKIMIICYTIPKIWCMTDAIIFYFGLFFAFLPPNSRKNQILRKLKKKYLDASSFYTCASKIMIRWCTVSEICYTMDGWTSRGTEVT